MRLVVGQKPAQCIRREHTIVLDQEHVITGLDQLPDFVVEGCYPTPASVDTELPARARYVSLDAEALGELALLDQVAGREEEVSLAIDECQQACPLTVALEQFQGGENFQQMLLAADG
jgi:hypothetical protein